MFAKYVSPCVRVDCCVLSDHGQWPVSSGRLFDRAYFDERSDLSLQDSRSDLVRCVIGHPEEQTTTGLGVK